jgi:uncharacterized repeat protein (TIGR03803 family)
VGRYWYLFLRTTIATVGALATLALSLQVYAETDFVVRPGRMASPVNMTEGPDHNLWFTEGVGLKIGRITDAGVITEFPISGAQGLCGITTGPDGNIWFTDELAGTISHISTSGTGLVTYPLPAGAEPQGIATGPDGNLWFVDEYVNPLHPANGFRIGSISVSGTVTEYFTGINPGPFNPVGFNPAQIVKGPDGNLWFTNDQASGVRLNIVGKITTAGAITIYDTGDTPIAITSGPDGNLWVIENSHVAKISTSGVETEYALMNGGGFYGITTGPDGNIWFTEAYDVGYVTPGGVVTEFALSEFTSVTYLSGITSGADGALWFLGDFTNNIGRVTTAGQLTNTYALNAGSQIGFNTLGPDHNIWFTGADLVGKVDTSGVVTTYPTSQGARPLVIAAGPDGNLWFVENGTSKVAKITTSGAITEYPVGQMAELWSITAGPDGNLWFTEAGSTYNNIVRITPDGIMTAFPIPTPNAGSFYVTKGPDGNLWFTEYNAQKVGKLDPSNGNITEYSAAFGAGLSAIVTGPDGNLWIMVNGLVGAIAKFSTAGNLIAEYPAQFYSFLGFTVGSDGALWFAQYYPNSVGRITTAGVVSTVPMVPPSALSDDVAIGADGKLWVAESGVGAIGRMSAIGGAGDAIIATSGSPFNGAVASFVDGTPTAHQGDFTANINWGDGTHSPGSVSGPTGGPFTVSGTHTYSVPQTYPLNVSLSDTVDNATYQASPGTAQVVSQLNYVLTASTNGSGKVTSADGDINCPSVCGYSYPSNTLVRLNAAPTVGWSFAGWSGACSGTGSCSVVMTQDLSVTATFTQNQGFYSLTVSTSGGGTVNSTDGFIICPGTCSHTYPSNAPVTLNATPAPGGVFSGWSGACSGTGSCMVIMSQNLPVTATFSGVQATAIHSFGSSQDGQNPLGNLIFDSAGNLDGTTSAGGLYGKGTVFEMSPNGTDTILHSFGSGNDGQNPFGNVIFDSAGNLYGTTSAGGMSGKGTVFELSPNGPETVLYNFGSGADGQNPYAGLIFDTAGNLYGTTVNGGTYGHGTAFELSPNGGGGWTETVLYSFGSGSDGQNPYAGLIFDNSGNLYGTTYGGGTYGYGTAFELSPNGGEGWIETVLYTFGNGTDGRNPHAGLIFDSSGNLYGTTVNGGANGGGTAFEVSPNGGGWAETVLYSFGSGSSDGLNPNAGLVFDYSGNLYSTTANGGLHSGGTVFELSPFNGANNRCCREVQIYNFGSGTDGRNPNAGVVFSTSGNLYGTTVSGGVYGGGTVFGIIAGPSPLQFVTAAPCRVVDTRNPDGAFGGPPISGGTMRSFPLAQSGNPCSIPSNVIAYSLNVTVVPGGTLGYLTIWPTGESEPVVSTLNSTDGRVKANAAIVPAGTPSGAVSVYVTNTTNVVLDIDGYFTAPASGTYQFYTLPPCRLVDTRGADGNLGGPRLLAQTPRSFPLLQSSCIPAGLNPLAYSLNFTVVPNPSGQPLGYLTVWPTGETQPVVSTLNNPTATVVANAAIVPAGTGGAVDVYAYDTTDLLIDIDGYFAAPGTGGLSMYPVAPCRVLDTRQSGGSFIGEKTVNVVGSACAPPTNAAAYIFNATVVPPGSMPFLTLWPNGEPQPGVSTLNAYDGFITSNMAIVPTTNGSIDAYAQKLTQLLLDISGYFAP